MLLQLVPYTNTSPPNHSIASASVAYFGSVLYRPLHLCKHTCGCNPAGAIQSEHLLAIMESEYLRSISASGARASASSPQAQQLNDELTALREQSHVSRRYWQQNLALSINHMIKLHDGTAADLIGFNQSIFETTKDMLIFMSSMVGSMQESGTLQYKHSSKVLDVLAKGDPLVPEYTLDMQPRKLFVVSDSVLIMGKRVCKR